jgi:hypothetical protein
MIRRAWTRVSGVTRTVPQSLGQSSKACTQFLLSTARSPMPAPGPLAWIRPSVCRHKKLAGVGHSWFGACASRSAADQERKCLRKAALVHKKPKIFRSHAREPSWKEVGASRGWPPRDPALWRGAAAAPPSPHCVRSRPFGDDQMARVGMTPTQETTPQSDPLWGPRMERAMVVLCRRRLTAGSEA